MARIILVTGGGRSGKSAYALKRAGEIGDSKAFVATCPKLDEEMRQRVLKHQEARREKGWKTIEESTNLAGVLGGAKECGVLLIDCLTLWINNLLYEAEQTGRQIDEGDIAELSEELLNACADRSGTVIFVTNEAGSGIVPDNALARKFRDLAGRCNQIVAAGADEVVLMVCGIPVPLKKGSENG